jgi:5-hydroxyisourate hydrolase-like protein (transthyretin family)
MLSFYLDPPAPQDDDRPAARDDREAVGLATFIQKPVLSRGGISLFGLLAAVTVFGLVITLALTRLVGQSAQDRDLALQVAAARNSATTTGTSSASGTVRLLTSGKPVSGVSVAFYSTDSATTPLASTATNDKGGYTLPHLPAGSYKVSFRGAGFVQLWYPGTPNESDATQVQLTTGQQRTGVDVNLGGVPATISGTVSGDDVSAATLFLETAPAGQTIVPAQGAPTDATASAIVKTVPIGADGTFTLADVPSPSVYQIRVVKPGYATSIQRIDIGAGEDRKGVQIALRRGDGLVSGTVTSGAGPLGGVTITATAGQSTANTVSLTEGSVGTFTLRALPTPATITLVASKTGYASQTLTLTLAPGQKLTGVSITLVRSSGSLEGVVTLVKGDSPAPGVSVSVTNGSLTISSQTESTGHVGFWRLGGLPVPGTYTVTFARTDLVSQTISVSLDSAGNITPGSFGAQITDKGIAVSMQAAWASVSGTVNQRTSAAGSGTEPIGEATVSLTSGNATYTTTTASTPSDSTGRFRLENLPPGTYTVSVNRRGTSPTSTIMTLRAGQAAAYDPVLSAAASITGLVRGTDGGPLRAGWTVELYQAAQYPGVVTATTKTDSSGRFTFDSVDAPQAYVIVVRPTSGSAQAASRTVQIEPSEQLGSANDSNPLYRSLVIEADPDE